MGNLRQSAKPPILPTLQAKGMRSWIAMSWSVCRERELLPSASLLHPQALPEAHTAAQEGSGDGRQAYWQSKAVGAGARGFAGTCLQARRRALPVASVRRLAAFVRIGIQSRPHGPYQEPWGVGI